MWDTVSSDTKSEHRFQNWRFIMINLSNDGRLSFVDCFCTEKFMFWNLKGNKSVSIVEEKNRRQIVCRTFSDYLTDFFLLWRFLQVYTHTNQICIVKHIFSCLSLIFNVFSSLVLEIEPPKQVIPSLFNVILLETKSELEDLSAS